MMWYSMCGMKAHSLRMYNVDDPPGVKCAPYSMCSTVCQVLGPYNFSLLSFDRENGLRAQHSGVIESGIWQNDDEREMLHAHAHRIRSCEVAAHGPDPKNGSHEHCHRTRISGRDQRFTCPPVRRYSHF